MIVPGKNPVLEALRSPHHIRQIYLQQGLPQDEKIQQILRLAEERNIHSLEVGEKKLSSLSEQQRHQGIAAEVNFEMQKLPKEIPFGYYIFVREAQDMGNIGAIIRTAESAGIDGVILTDPHLCNHPTVVRTSMGAVFHTPIYYGSLFQVIKAFHEQAFQICAIEIDGNESLYSGDFTMPTLMIVGGEDHGISAEVQAKCDHVYKIPQLGKVNSLNMSVAAGVAVYEAVRQQSSNS